MTLTLPTLDACTRQEMLRAFEDEQASAAPYVPAGMSALGRESFPVLVQAAITSGTDDSLGSALQVPAFWHGAGAADRWNDPKAGVMEAASLLGVNEFDTWYVRGVAARLAEEGEERCEVFRAARHACLLSDCDAWDGATVSLDRVVDGHRARYWPEPGDHDAFSVPLGPGCYHSIRRCPRPAPERVAIP